MMSAYLLRIGHGLSFAIGIAFANKVDRKDSHIYVVLGDGECQEGSIWEGALSAPTLELDNLTVVVDHNKLQAMDELENIVHMQPFADKWKAFGWNVVEIDGHNYEEIKHALSSRNWPFLLPYLTYLPRIFLNLNTALVNLFYIYHIR